jgi:fatty acid desaturase
LREEIRALGELSPGWFCLALGFDLTIAAGAIVLSEFYFFNALAYVLAVILIGSRLHALGILMHECVHYRAFRSRKLNMFVAELLGWVILTSAEGYRTHHLAHHRHLNTLEDPDWVRKNQQRAFDYPKSKLGLVQALLYQLSGIGIARLFLDIKTSARFKQVSLRNRLLRLASYLGALALCGATGTVSKLALYWLVPMLTTFPMLFYVRSVAEHHGNLAYDHPYTNSRSTIACAWERFLFLPHHVGCHLEHHLYPHVPFYRLPHLHRLLMERSDYSARAHVTRGVCTGLLREWTSPGAAPATKQIASAAR